MGILEADAWTPAVSAAGRVRRYEPSAGVSQRKAIQITNNTLGNVFLARTGVPAQTAQQADFVVPPRATGEYPLEYGECSLYWDGAVSIGGDLISVVFSDDAVAPNIKPGVNPVGGASSPVQVTTRYKVAGTPTAPVVLTTLSGLNIGSVYIYNNTIAQCQLYTTGGIPALILTIRPFSWATLPLNMASGGVQVLYTNPLLWLASDTLMIAYSDINYSVPFPSGAGSLPTPLDLLYDDTDFANPGNQFSVTAFIAAAGSAPILTLTPGQSVLVTKVTVGLTANAAGANGAQINLQLGFTGTAGVDAVVAYATAGALNVQDSSTSDAPFIWRNFSAANKAANLVTGGGIALAHALIQGRYLA